MYVIVFERFSQNPEERLNVGNVNCTKCTKAEGVSGGNFPWIDGKSMFVAIVVNTLEIPVVIIWI